MGWGGGGDQNLIPKSARVPGILHKPRTIPACTDLHWVKAVHGKEVSIKGKEIRLERGKRWGCRIQAKNKASP